MEIGDFQRVYTSERRAKKAHLLDPIRSANRGDPAMCKRVPFLGTWLGTGNYRETWRASRMPTCKYCLRGARSLTDRVNERRQRFMKYIEVRDGHWVWNGATSAGHPICMLKGVYDGAVKAYRVAFYLFRGKHVKGFFRQCDHDMCVLPEHYGPARRVGWHQNPERRKEIRAQRGRRKGRVEP